MELKVLCGCGQKFKFDVEPVNGQMPFKVLCPVCNADDTQLANATIAEKLAPNAATAAPPPVTAPVPGRLRISSSSTMALPGMAASADNSPPRAAAAISRQPAISGDQPKSSGECNLGLGILGTILGSGVGAALMYGFYALANFRFPLMGTCIGVLTGLAARYLYKGRGATLGGISAGVAVAATSGTLFLIYGELQAIYFVSIGFSGYFAYRIAG